MCSLPLLRYYEYEYDMLTLAKYKYLFCTLYILSFVYLYPVYRICCLHLFVYSIHCKAND